MAVDGVYSVEVSMPEGKRSLSIQLQSGGKSVSGYVDGPFGKHAFSGGTVNGDDVSFTVRLRPGQEKKSGGSPVKTEKGFFGKLGGFLSSSLSGPSIVKAPESDEEPSTQEMPVGFKATVKGDGISGEMQFGDYASGPFTGLRVQE